jgi:hypothetical protein
LISSHDHEQLSHAVACCYAWTACPNH